MHLALNTIIALSDPKLQNKFYMLDSEETVIPMYNIVQPDQIIQVRFIPRLGLILPTGEILNSTQAQLFRLADHLPVLGLDQYDYDEHENLKIYDVDAPKVITDPFLAIVLLSPLAQSRTYRHWYVSDEPLMQYAKLKIPVKSLESTRYEVLLLEFVRLDEFEIQTIKIKDAEISTPHAATSYRLL